MRKISMNREVYPHISTDATGFIRVLNRLIKHVPMDTINYPDVTILEEFDTDTEYYNLCKQYLTSIGIKRKIGQLCLHRLNVSIPPHDDKLFISSCEFYSTALFIPLKFGSQRMNVNSDIPITSYLWHNNNHHRIKCGLPMMFNATKEHALITTHRIDCAVIFFKR